LEWAALLTWLTSISDQANAVATTWADKYRRALRASRTIGYDNRSL